MLGLPLACVASACTTRPCCVSTTAAWVMEQNFAALALDRRCDGRQPTKLSVAERPHMAAAKQLRLGWVRTERRSPASWTEQAHA
jgi:hypothetical protein